MQTFREARSVIQKRSGFILNTQNGSPFKCWLPLGTSLKQSGQTIGNYQCTLLWEFLPGVGVFLFNLVLVQAQTNVVSDSALSRGACAYLWSKCVNWQATVSARTVL